MKPFELPISAADTLDIHVGCTLAYFSEIKTKIQLLIRPAPGPGCYLLDEVLTHDRGDAMESFVDAHGNTVLLASLLPGLNEIRHSALLRVPRQRAASPAAAGDTAVTHDVLRYTLPSRYCESDKLVSMAAQLFGGAASTRAVVQDICDWTHDHIEYRYGSGDATLSAWEAIRRGYGVCRDFAHVMIALCRALDIPARYVAGHIPLLGTAVPGSDVGIDFHAYVEVYIGGQWYVYDPRHNRADHFHIKLAHGMDAVDAAFATFHGPVTPAGFHVWSYATDVLRGPASQPCGGGPSLQDVNSSAAAHAR